MVGDWPFEGRPALTPVEYLASIGARIVSVFDARTQDSGNVSFALDAADRRWFVKSAGDPADTAPLLPHAARVALLVNAARLAASLAHPALPRLHGVLASAWGPLLVYDWAPGELLHAPAARRDDPSSAHQRFRALAPDEIASALGVVLDVHARLGAQGWVACDFYDGAMIYDFAARRLWLVDLDTYHLGPFVNAMGRMFGSTRFMAPEELELGAVIDARTTVFTLGRTISIFLGDGTLDSAGFRGTAAQRAAMLTACQARPAERFQSVAELAAAWRS
jgi:serine/threonine-protein kinase